MLQPIVFAIVTAAALYVAGRNFLKIRRNILLGKDEQPPAPKGESEQRWRNVLLVAFGQKKMFARPIPAIFHFFIYAAFLLTQIELIEIFVDGFTGSHRIFSGALGGFYTFIIGLIELLSVLAFVATVIFLARRNVLRINRFHKQEMKGWPTKDANLILFGEILLLTGIFSMNGADTVLQSMGAEHYPQAGPFLVSSSLGPALFGGLGEGALMVIERFGWWLHILVVYGFLIYLSVSKHLHIILAFPNTYFARLNPRGEMANMPAIQKEVASMMNPEAAPSEPQPETELSFGANDVTKLHWQDLLAAYTCTECGRCTSVCPANLTGKKLSPRKIMMDVRDRCEEVGRTMDEQKSASPIDDGKTLFDYISREEIHACTTCNACVEACPVLINPLDIILQLRRHEILMESAGPSDWLPLFNSLENSQAAWAVSTERDGWKLLV
ncbi:MAG: (Fe-S)-binding protein [Saprospiraceae bacterium]|nr:(Fe-S)-binding protein [Saprospiraceae bacterium]